jgi:serine/threonine protein kinase
VIPATDITPGQTLGRYELLVPIAQGGMAVVWAARLKGSRGFQKVVAVKSMLPSLSADPQFEEMFLAEAELASRIKHPNVCEILDLGEQDGTLFIVMEWVDGEPLSTLQKASRAIGGVPVPVALRIGIAAAMGLHAAHELRSDDGDLVGLVHRDVSPQNVLVTCEGVVKIVDFGVAKATAADTGRTRAGQIKGKAPFMSPEQALGRIVDRRTDVFALGIVLYQMLAGRHPFRGETEMATLNRITDKEPAAPLDKLLADCPPSLAAAIGIALEKDESKRFQTMTDLARALERALADVLAAAEIKERERLREELGPDAPPPSTTRAKGDVAAFVRSVIGDRTEKRKQAIKSAIKASGGRTWDTGIISAVVPTTVPPAAPSSPTAIGGHGAPPWGAPAPPGWSTPPPPYPGQGAERSSRPSDPTHGSPSSYPGMGPSPSQPSYPPYPSAPPFGGGQVSGVSSVATAVDGNRSVRPSTPGTGAGFVRGDEPQLPLRRGFKRWIAAGAGLLAIGVLAGVTLGGRRGSETTPAPAAAAPPEVAPAASIEATAEATPAPPPTAEPSAVVTEPSSVPFDSLDTEPAKRPRMGGPRPAAAAPAPSAKPGSSATSAKTAAPRVPQIRDPGF